MVTCRLVGGLSNQMFQIAAAYSLARKNDTQLVIDFNLYGGGSQGFPPNKYRDTIFRKIKNDKVFFVQNYYFEVGFAYHEIPYSEDLSIHGYFQSEKYFLDFKEEVLNLFDLPQLSYTQMYGIPIDITLTSVHVRRGDYLKIPEFHPLCEIEYYKKAMDLIGDSNFIFASDDMDWVKENFKGPNIFYSATGDELGDLKLMSICDNNIIANSSFSWWGAYLNKNPNKIIISPKNENWFGPQGPQDTQDLIPDSWIML